MTDTEKAALERRIDELCAEVERLHADQAHWELGNCPSCPNVASLQETLEQNAKLRELVSELWASCPVHDNDCDECRHKDGRTGCELYDRMLGLGVDE